jgi:hypothetical protein
MLAAWRDDLVAPAFAPSRELDPTTDGLPADGRVRGAALRPASAGPADGGSARPPGRRERPARPARGGRVRPGRLIGAAVLLVAVLGGGLTVGAATGQPGTPLWPVTRLVYAERADSRVAARTVADLLARAELALRERRHDDAEPLLRQAWALLPQVRERADHERLRADLTRLIDALLTATVTPSATPTPSATTGPVPTPVRSAPAATPSPTPAPGGVLPGLPPLLPSLPPILPSLLPDLPLL